MLRTTVLALGVSAAAGFGAAPSMVPASRVSRSAVSMAEGPGQVSSARRFLLHTGVVGFITAG